MNENKKRKKWKIPDLKSETYFQFISLVFLLMGFMLFFVCFIKRLHPMEVEVLSSPIHYMVLGVVCFIVFLVKHIENEKNK